MIIYAARNFLYGSAKQGEEFLMLLNKNHRLKIKTWLVQQLIQCVAHVRSAIVYRVAMYKAKHPEQMQKQTLKRILNQQKNTEFGKKFDFATINKPEEYRRRLPLFDYEELRPYIEKQEATGLPILNAENPVLYALTSGTTGKPKYIPILKSTLKTFKKNQSLFFAAVLREHADALNGRIAAIVSPAIEGTYPGSKTPVGSSSGHMYKDMPAMVKNKYIFPIEIFEIEDYDLKYRTILRILLNGADVSYFGTANPSTLIKLISVLNERADVFLEDLRDGKFSDMDRLPTQIQNVVKKHIFADRVWAQKLAKISLTEGQIRFKDLLPNLKVVTTWTGGSCGIFIKQLQGQFDDTTVIREVGYLSSEFRGNTPISLQANTGLPALDTYYYEFVKKNDWENEKLNFVGLHELVDKELYYIFITTDSGLYRYKMNDIVEADGLCHKTPLIRFVQKGKGVTNITGEKLYESQVIYGVQYFEKICNLTSSFFICGANEVTCGYTLYYQPVADSSDAVAARLPSLELHFDSALKSINMEYKTKRESGRLRAPTIKILEEGTFEKFKTHCLGLGQREGQFKIIALGFEREFSFDFAGCTINAARKSAAEKRERNAWV